MQNQLQTTTAPSLHNERGITLAVAVFALVMIGTMISSAFFLGLQEQRGGFNTIRHQQAFEAAEAGAQLTLASWDVGTFNRLAAGDSVTFAGSVGSGVGWYRGSVTRLSDMIYLIRSEGFSPDSVARHHVGLMARLKTLEVDAYAALTTQDKTTVRGSPTLDGTDHVPVGWGGCPAVLPPAPGIRIGDEDDLTREGNAHDIYGAPPVLEDTTVTSTSLLSYGDQAFDDLKDLATKILTPAMYSQIQPSTVGGLCKTSDLQNWGDPSNPGGACGSYFPVVYADGDVTIKGKTGQGILLVEGDLTVEGGFEFVGLVIVTGRLATSGTGQKFTGAVIAANEAGAMNDIAGNPTFSYSNCAVLRVLMTIAPGELLHERGWVSLF